MADGTDIVPPDLQAIRSRVREIEEMCRNLEDDVSELNSTDSEKLLMECALHFQSAAENVVSESADVCGFAENDLDAYAESLAKMLNSVETENTNICSEIEVLTRTHIGDFNRLETDLERLKCSLDFATLQDMEEVKGDECVNSTYSEDQMNLISTYDYKELELVELENQIERRRIILKSLQDLDGACKWFDVIEQIEDTFTGLKVIAFNENCIRISLQTCVPELEGLLPQQKMKGFNELVKVDHELLIEVLEGAAGLKNVEIFPNDVCINGAIDAAKNLSKSSLQWLVTKIQDKITLCTVRRLLVKSVNESRHSLEYFDKDEMIVAHVVGQLDVLIKISQGWPLVNSLLKLTHIKSSDHQHQDISLMFLCKVKERANSLASHIRQSLLAFVDAVENILEDQMRLELHSDGFVNDSLKGY